MRCRLPDRDRLTQIHQKGLRNAKANNVIDRGLPWPGRASLPIGGLGNNLEIHTSMQDLDDHLQDVNNFFRGKTEAT